MHIAYRYRVKSLSGALNQQARTVNFVWNFFNDAQKSALKWGKKWPTAIDLEKLTTGSSAELGLRADTICAISRQYVQSRKRGRKAKLRYRGMRSLGWIPLKGRNIRQDGDAFVVHGTRYRVFDPRPIPGKIVDGTSFSRDAKGNWFLNVTVELPDEQPRSIQSGVGIDLGLKEFAALSNGEMIPNPRHLQQLAGKLATAQRAKKKRLAASIHGRIGNTRRDFLHKLSTRIVREFDFVAVGNVNAAKLAKTSMAKSVNDAGWSSFRNMLRYKAITHGAWYEEVNERFTSQVCSSCGVIPDSRPKGIADLGIRHWVCSDCGASHDRDVNAAKNILARSGHRAPVEGAH